MVRLSRQLAPHIDLALDAPEADATLRVPLQRSIEAPVESLLEMGRHVAEVPFF